MNTCVCVLYVGVSHCLCEKFNQLCGIEETQRTPIGIQGSQPTPISHHTVTAKHLHYETLTPTILKDTSDYLEKYTAVTAHYLEEYTEDKMTTEIQKAKPT